MLPTHGTFSFAMSLKTLGAPLPTHGPPMHGSGERAAGGDGSRPHRPHAMSQRSMPPLVDPRPIRAPAMQLGSTATSLGFGGTMGSRSAPSLIPPPTPSYLMPTPASVRMKEEMAAINFTATGPLMTTNKIVHATKLASRALRFKGAPWADHNMTSNEPARGRWRDTRTDAEDLTRDMTEVPINRLPETLRSFARPKPQLEQLAKIGAAIKVQGAIRRFKAVKDKERKLAAPKHAAATRIQSAGRRRHAQSEVADKKRAEHRAMAEKLYPTTPVKQVKPEPISISHSREASLYQGGLFASPRSAAKSQSAARLAAMSPAGAMSGHKMVMSAERAVANKPMPSELKAPPAPTWFSQVGSTQVQTISLGGA